MLVSTRGRYALRVIIYLAENDNGSYIPMKQVADNQNISLKYLEQILPILTKNGIVDAVHGKGGGYKLACEPSKCTVYDVLKLTENGFSSVACLEEGAPKCPRVDQCRTIDLWRGLNSTVHDYLKNVTISDLILK